MKLIALEIKRCLKNPVFWITIIILFMFINAQYTEDVSDWIIKKPEPNQQSYGLTATDDMGIIRRESLSNLIMEYLRNSYTTYPYGFYRNVELKDEKIKEMEKLLSALTGVSLNDIKSIGNVSTTEESSRNINEEIDKLISSSEKNVTDNEYLKIMEEVDRLLGGGSFYSEKMIASKFGERPETYEEAVLEYNQMINEDKITGAFARLFCDYLGIVIGFLPIFLSVSLWYQDRRNKLNQILYSKQTSSIKIVLCRFMAMFVLFTVAILAIATYYNVEIIKANGMENVDFFSFYKYSFLWVVPTLMTVLSVGTFTTILSDSPIGIMVMLIWWFITLFGGLGNIDGDYGYKLILRHNIIGNTQTYFNNLHQVLLNRGIYVCISIILILISIKVYDKKRKGEFLYESNK